MAGDLSLGTSSPIRWRLGAEWEQTGPQAESGEEAPTAHSFLLGGFFPTRDSWVGEPGCFAPLTSTLPRPMDVFVSGV